MAFDPLKFRCPDESTYQGVKYIESLFGPPCWEKVQQWRGHPSDVMLAAYPKTGTTWCSAMMNFILCGADTEKANSEDKLLDKIPYLERNRPDEPLMCDQLESKPPPRIFKTHLRYERVKHIVEEDKCKVILLLRNPKDTLISYYHFYRMCADFGSFPGTFTDFFQLFQAKGLLYGDLFEWYEGWWRHSHLENVLVLKYEEMVEDPFSAADKIAKFLNVSLSPAELQKVVQASSFNEMKKNPSTNMEHVKVLNHEVSHFFRKGTVGDWKDEMTEEQSTFLDEMNKKYFEPIGLTFKYS